MSAPIPSRLVARLSSRTAWTCSSCRSQIRPNTFSNLANLRLPRRYGSSKAKENTRSSRWTYSSSGQAGQKRRILFASTGTAVAGGAVATATVGATVLGYLDDIGNDIKQSYEATQRAGRVGVALVVCINDYRTTLNQREKVEDEEERAMLLNACHQRCADRTLEVLEKNGGVFIKLGQHLSAMNYLLPSEWTTTFIPLQDRCPVSSLESIEQMYLADTGETIDSFFFEFAPEPIGAASLAQVHMATVRETGQRVAVKVQHPTLAQWAPLDLALTRWTFQALKRFFPEYDMEWLSSEMEVSLPIELDFREEGANARRTAAHFAALPHLPLIIPDVIWARNRILVMACESGKRLDDIAYLDSQRIDRDEVSAALARIFNEMIFGEGAPLHCDPHGGNISIRPASPATRRRSGHNFEIVLYDHGLYRDIPTALRRSYAKMWLAVIDGDIPRMRRYAHEVAGISDEQFPLFASAITGRDYTVIDSAKMNVATTPRTEQETQSMGAALQEGLLADLVGMLGQVPRVVLLILKTNDLTRSLDESLQTRQGPVRSFLILAGYCARTVFNEKLEQIREGGRSLLWPPNALRVTVAWLEYAKTQIKIDVFEVWLKAKRILGFKPMELNAFSG